jgi:hypothetical protein
LFAGHTGEPLDEVVNSGAVLKILEQRFDRHAGPTKDKSPAYYIRRRRYFIAIGPIEHTKTLPPPTAIRNSVVILFYPLQFACGLAASAVSKTRLWPVFCCLQNRLNELDENLAIEIREW